MPPRHLDDRVFEDETEKKYVHPLTDSGDEEEEEVPMVIVWHNVAFWLTLHILGAYSIYCIPSCSLMSLLFAFGGYGLSALGVTAGAHRLWSHRSYKAKWPLRMFLVFCNTIACQNDIIEWSRDHRVHHKYSETNADPHNALRGFFFAHMGWLMVRKHPEVKAKGKGIDLSDLYADPILRFQRKHFLVLTGVVSFFFPTVIPAYFWNESMVNAFFVCAVFRYLFSLHCTWLVNSAAHMWGMRPYDESINPSENLLVSLGAIGEGFHNYHHTFPQDYRTSEFLSVFNLTAAFINLMAKLGQAYDLKTVSEEMILARRKRTGDMQSRNPSRQATKTK